MSIGTIAFRSALAAGVALVAWHKTTSSARAYDPDKPKARDEALRPGVAKDLRDVPGHLCESGVPGRCDASDVGDWVWSYWEYGVSPMRHAAMSLQGVAPEDNAVAQGLIAQASSIYQKFLADYPGWNVSVKEVASEPGREYTAIQEINANMDVAIGLKNELLQTFGTIAPGVIPDGLDPGDHDELEPKDVDIAPYAAAGTVFGLGMALAFVVASNKKNQKPGG